MAKTAAERMRASRAKKRNIATVKSATSVTITGRNTPGATACEEACVPGVRVPGPLSVYCERRWSYLQERGYVWVPERGRACKYSASDVVNIGVVVPGDPAYEGIADGKKHI